MTESAPTLEVLVPMGAPPVPPSEDEAVLAEHYAELRLPWVRANMIASLDGASAGPDGRSGSINGPADLRAFTTLRAWADVVLVGAGTVRAEGYRGPRLRRALRERRVREGRPENPELAVVTGSGDLSEELLADAPWVFTTEGAPGLDRLREVLPAERLHVHGGEGVDVARVVRTLVGAGRERVLTEGGPRLLGALLEAGALDELCLTWSPFVVGGEADRLVRGASAALREVELVRLLRADGVLLGRWVLGARG